MDVHAIGGDNATYYDFDSAMHRVSMSIESVRKQNNAISGRISAVLELFDQIFVFIDDGYHLCDIVPAAERLIIMTLDLLNRMLCRKVDMGKIIKPMQITKRNSRRSRHCSTGMTFSSSMMLLCLRLTRQHIWQ
jgi:hypothetical protein